MVVGRNDRAIAKALATMDNMGLMLLRRFKVEILVPKQRNMIDTEYADEFEELSMFCPYYNWADAEGSKCVKLESELRPEIKYFIGYQQIHQFFYIGEQVQDL